MSKGPVPELGDGIPRQGEERWLGVRLTGTEREVAVGNVQGAVYLEFWWLVWPLVHQGASAVIGGPGMVMRGGPIGGRLGRH